MNKINELFGKDINVVNVGIESFYNSLRDQKVDTVQVDWKPAAGGNEKLQAILDKLKR